MGQSSQSKVVSVNNQLIGALQKCGKKTLVLGGKAWATQDIVAKLTAENTAIAASSSAKAQWVKASATVKADRTANDALRAALHQAVLVQFGADPAVLDAFGYAKPRTRTPASSEAKVIAAAKRLATRKARGTLGSKQRKAIKGALTTPQAFAVTVTAAAAAAAPVTAPNGTTTQK